jgi:predicted nucleotidyltransferase
LPHALGGTIVFETVHGSRAYGLATESSDTDRRGVFVPSRRALFGFAPHPEQVELEPERVLYDVRKLFRLAAVSNPRSSRSCSPNRPTTSR